VETYKVKASFFPMAAVSINAINVTDPGCRPSNQSDAIRGFDALDHKRYEERAVAGLQAVANRMSEARKNELKHWFAAHGRLHHADEALSANDLVARPGRCGRGETHRCSQDKACQMAGKSIA